MKNKPIRHKELNTFQFKTFSERINEIDVDIFHYVSHRNEENDEETETYFYQTLQKWNFLNLTEGYCSFKKKVRNIVTLPQLINQKQFVIDTLIEYLEKRDILFLQPILELVVAVSKDLQKDFYEYFPRCLIVIIDLLRTKDTEQIEYTFTSLAYLFKFLWRYLIQNIKTVFDLLLPLLADTQPTYVNNFAAESFAFVDVVNYYLK
ncbi:small subunit processome component 20 [Apis mellifera caucasica]|nr:small subunit processome component 20 [Apis mellifera caucasica]KAG9434531.1 small subunit processome component 20 [Apis mellifera carnica]